MESDLYGPMRDEFKSEILREVMQFIIEEDIPIMVGGDFNLVREINEKSSRKSYAAF